MPIKAFSSTLVKEHESLLKSFLDVDINIKIKQINTILRKIERAITLVYITPDHWDDDWVSF